MRTAAVVLLVLTVVAPSALAAEPGGYTVPLDTGHEQVGDVTVDGTTYEVYRYDNVLPYVSGYEFFGDGRVNDGDVARRVRRAYAWKTAVNEEMKDEEIGELRDVGETARRARDVVSVPLEAANSTLRVLGGGSSERNPAVAAVPGLNTTETAVRAARDELLRWDDRVGNASDDVVRFAEVADELRRGNTTRHDELPRLAVDAETGLGDAVEASSTVAESLGAAANRTGSVAGRVENVTFVGDRLGPPLRSVESSMRNATVRIEAFEFSASEARDTVERVRNRASDEETTLSGGWHARRSAGLRLYGTVLVWVAVLLGGYGYYRRRDHNM